MADSNTYGTRDGNYFFESPGDGSKTRYYLLIQSTGPNKGEITIKEPSGFSTESDRTVGTIPLDNSFKPNINNSSPQEQAYFSKAEVQKRIKNHAVITAQKEGEKNAQQLIFPNSASGEDSADAQAPTPEASPGEGATQEQVSEGLKGYNQKSGAIKDGDYRKKYTGGVKGNYYIYPIDMSEQQDRIKFTMYRYKSKNINISNISDLSKSIFSGENKGEFMGTVFLPIQPSISDSNVVKWGDDPMNSLEAIAATAAYGTIQKGGEALGESIEGVQNLIQGSNTSIKAALTSVLAGNAANNKNFLTRSQGAILNPNLELLFDAPTLRTFTFTFDMSAREEKELDEIMRIIRFFKQGMSVKKSDSYLFLKTPNVFDIEYKFQSDKEHKYLNKIKTCVLQTCSVNYTPEGNYATFENGGMTKYNMQLSFSEIDPIYDNDYGTDDNTTNIGY